MSRESGPAFTTCPRSDCGAMLQYTETGPAICAHGHEFDVYHHNALLQIVGPDFKRGGVMYVPAATYSKLMDRGARLWNSLVHFSDEHSNKFKGKLLDIAIELRDEAKADGRHEKTQMDTEVERMKAAGWRSYEGWS